MRICPSAREAAICASDLAFQWLNHWHPTSFGVPCGGYRALSPEEAENAELEDDDDEDETEERDTSATGRKIRTPQRVLGSAGR